ncbi:MAG: NUDIX hydrolase [Chloroflexota bacterium]|nr:NUDIX hydrolase [Chloroflexota bacterium]
MKSQSTNIILMNDKNQVLLQLRDDTPTIAYPAMWSLPGGHLEEGEAPEQCIIREMKEELGVELETAPLFVAAQRSYGFEYTFWSKATFHVEDIALTEGQAIRWFPFEEIKNTTLGYEDNTILETFFQEKPYLASSISGPLIQ